MYLNNLGGFKFDVLRYLGGCNGYIRNVVDVDKVCKGKSE